MKKIAHILLLFVLIFGTNHSFSQTKNPKKNTTKTIWVNSYKSPCDLGLYKTQCLMVKYDEKQANWDFFSEQIQGFNYESGFFYKLKVKVETIENPPADASSLKYTLIKLLDKKKVIQTILPTQDWIISYYLSENGTPKPALKTSHIRIDQSKRAFAGTADCNSISGKVSIDGDKIKFDNLTTTRMACENAEQEMLFVQTLKHANRFVLNGCTLMLYNGQIAIAELESCL